MSSNSDQDRPVAHSEFQDNLSILRQITFFSGLPIELLKVFAYLCTREVFNPGQHLFSQGDDDGCGFYLISGKTELLRKQQEIEYTVKTYEKGTFLGMLTLLGNMPRLYSLRAKEPSVCLVITREKFTKALERFPEIMPKLIQTIVNRIELWDKQAIYDNHADWQSGDRAHIGISAI